MEKFYEASLFYLSGFGMAFSNEEGYSFFIAFTIGIYFFVSSADESLVGITFGIFSDLSGF